jgi:hypothetical protein
MLTNKFKRQIRRVLRNQNSAKAPRLAPVHYTIQQRACFATVLENVSEGGRVALFYEGMDCDCYKTRNVSHMPRPTPVAAWQIIERIYEGAEGPTTAFFDRPSCYPEGHASADLALEAFEDGHPSTVYDRSL